MPGEAALLPASAQEQALVSQEPEALPPLTRARVSELVLYAITNDDAGMRCQASSRQYLALKLLAASDETQNPGGKGNTGRIYQVNLICMVYIFMKTCVHVCCVRSAWFCHPGRTGRAGPYGFALLYQPERISQPLDTTLLAHKGPLAQQAWG